MSNTAARDEARETYVLPDDPSPYKQAEVSILREGFVKGYEAARAKDAELIQRLVDALDGLVEDRGGIIVAMRRSHKALDAAADAGFKPSDR